MKRFGIFLSIVFVCISPASAQDALPPAAQKAMNAIDAEKIRATVKYLSDDALQGPRTGPERGQNAGGRNCRAVQELWSGARWRPRNVFSADQFFWRDDRPQADQVLFCSQVRTRDGTEICG